MLEIRNKTRGPVQLIVKSFSNRREHSKSFTTLNIPGLQTVMLEDERVYDVSVERLKKWDMISARYIPNNEIKKRTTKEN